MSSKRNHPPEFKAKVAIEAIASNKSIAELSARFDVHPSQISEWKSQLIKRAANAFRLSPRPYWTGDESQQGNISDDEVHHTPYPAEENKGK